LNGKYNTTKLDRGDEKEETRGSTKRSGSKLLNKNNNGPDKGKSNADQQKLLSLIAHEIRAPIKGVLGLMEHCLKYFPEETLLLTDQDKDLHYCLFKSTSLLSILLETCTCILEVSKPTPPVVKYTEFDFPLICEDLRELFNIDLKEKNLSFDVEYTCNKWIRSEPIRLR
jgi:signal transduction histidine kinase